MDQFRPPGDADFDNPYAPPKSTFEPERPLLAQSLSIPFSIDSITSTAWSIFKENLGTSLWVVWSVMLVNFGLGLALNGLMAGLQAAMPGDLMRIHAIYWTCYVVSLILQVWLGIGMTQCLFKIVRGEHVSFDQLFGGGRYILTVILGAIMYGLLFAATLAVPAVVAGVGFVAIQNQAPWGLVAVIIGFALVFFLAIYLAARLFQFYYLIIDRDAGILESIGLSWQITRGKAGTIILVYLLQMVLAVGGVLALCVGLIFTIPLSHLLMVVTYMAMVGTGKPADRMPFANWEEDLQVE
jgi:hypothetical protein